MTLLIGFILMLGVSIGWITWFLYYPLRSNELDLQTSNVELAKQKINELRADVEQGLLEQSQLEEVQNEITQTLAQELAQIPVNSKQPEQVMNYWVIGFLILALPLMSLGLYQQLAPEVVSDAPEITLQDSVKKIRQHLEDNEQDIKAWKMLALAYYELKELDESVKAYERAYQLGDREVQTLIRYASTLVVRNDDQFFEKPVNLIKQALKIEPNAPDALYLAGVFALNQQDLILAKGLWTKAIKFLPVDSQDRIALKAMLQELQTVEQDASVKNTLSKIIIQVEITIPKALKINRKNDFIMIYAKAAKGRPMPIAIQKIKLSEFSGRVELSERNSIMPSAPLSKADKVVIIARISKTGSARRQVDDIEVSSQVVDAQKSPQINLVFSP
jgi:cytochrome c-type biogenesis protein CcmH